MKKYLLIVFSATAFSINAQNVGIGNNNPQYKLDVSGDVSLTGKLRLNGVATANKVLKTDVNGDPVWSDDNNTTYTAGTGLLLSGTTFNLSNIGTAGTYRSVTVDAQGRVTAGTNPTTLAGYGITDAVPSTRSITINGTANRVTVTGGTQDLSGNRTWTLSGPQDIHTAAIPAFTSGIYNSSNTVVNDISPYIRLTNTTTGGTAGDGLILGVDGGGGAWVANKENTSLKFATNDIARLEITNAGHLLPNATNTYDLGSSALRFRDAYFAGRIYGNGSVSTYGAISVLGTKGGYGGINFRDASGTNIATLMVHSQYQGVYNSTDNAWLWYFNNGVLTEGTVPWANLSGVPATFTPAAHNHSAADITSGTLTVARGGTGAATLTSGNILTGNGTGAIQSTLTYSTASTANALVQRDVNGDINIRYGFSQFLNMSHAASTRNTDNVFYSSNDDYIRKNNASGFRTSLGLGSMATQNANAVTITGGTVAGSTVSGNISGGAGFLNGFASGFGANEIGGPSGAFIDLKDNAADDFDVRLIYFSNSVFDITNRTAGVRLNQDAGAWSSLSDSTKKTDFKEVTDGNEFLKSFESIKLGSWRYKTADKEDRHYGPMAQDFFALFGNDGLGFVGNDTTISTMDIDGVMMIAIKALIKEKNKQEEEIAFLKEKNILFEARDQEYQDLKVELEKLKSYIYSEAKK